MAQASIATLFDRANLINMYASCPKPVPRRAEPSILIVEDEILIAMGLELLLNQFGFCSAGFADTPAMAYRLVERARPDLAIVDIRLAGGTDGLEVIRRLSAAGIPVIASSAHGSPDDAASAGALDMLVKPYTAEQLQVAVSKVLGEKGCGREVPVG